MNWLIYSILRVHTPEAIFALISAVVIVWSVAYNTTKIGKAYTCWASRTWTTRVEVFIWQPKSKHCIARRAFRPTQPRKTSRQSKIELFSRRKARLTLRSFEAILAKFLFSYLKHKQSYNKVEVIKHYIFTWTFLKQV